MALTTSRESPWARREICRCTWQYFNSETETRWRLIPHPFPWSDPIFPRTVDPTDITSLASGISLLYLRFSWVNVAAQAPGQIPIEYPEFGHIGWTIHHRYPLCSWSSDIYQFVISSSHSFLHGLPLFISLRLCKNKCLQRQLMSRGSGFESQRRRKERGYRQSNQVKDGMHEKLSVENGEECYGTGKLRWQSESLRKIKETKSRSSSDFPETRPER
jgi:hypothetical protein